MKIKSVSFWCKDIEVTRDFYISYFNATSNAKYTNPITGFQSYNLIFDNDVRVELMSKSTVLPRLGKADNDYVGIAHLSFFVGSDEAVDSLIEQLRGDGYHIASHPRRSVDGFYQGSVIDPDGTRIEIVA